MVKGSNLKEKSKRKKKGVRIQAIISRIQTPDPELGHLGPDFDSGSGLESAFTDPSPGAALTQGLSDLFLQTFYGPSGLSGLDFVPWGYAAVCVWRRGESAFVKSGLKEEKLSFRPHYFFLDCAQVFNTSRGGGSEAPTCRMARWGLQVNIHRTSFIKLNFNPRVCLYDYFLHSFLYGPYVRERL